MSAAIILDVETTGFKDPEVIELALSQPLDASLCVWGMAAPVSTTAMRFRPSKPISVGALATHHILDEELAQCPPWPGAFDIQQLYPGVSYLIGHNVDHDWKAIGSPPGMARICTLSLSRRLFPDLDAHKLGAMIYSIMPHPTAREILKNAHSAEADVMMTCDLLFYICHKLAIHDWEHLYRESEESRIPIRFPAGKYGPKDGKPGAVIDEIKRLDPRYIDWCLSGQWDKVNEDPYFRRALTR